MESPLIQSGNESKHVIVKSDLENEEVIEQKEEKMGDQPPYSCYNEIKFFFQRGIPYTLSAMLEWGLPPILAMGFAGQTSNSEHLQTVLGYARVFYNVTCLMVACGAWSYLGTCIPGAIGADRRDRIPVYLRRSLLLSFLVMIPSYILAFFSQPTLEVFNVDSEVASEVGVYTRWFILVCSGMIIEGNFQIIFANLLWNKLDASVSLITGLGLDVAASWFFILHLDLGIYGIIWTQLCVKASRVLAWLLALYPTGVHKLVLYSETTSKEPFLPWEEVKIAMGLIIPSILNCFSGWLIFEVQILILANIHGVPKEALAAGAIWIQLESVLASMQQGWISVVNLRAVYMLGQKDPNAFNSWIASCSYASMCVVVINIFLWIFSEHIMRALSNNSDVRLWLDKFWWILVIHSQLRVMACVVGSLMNPVGWAVWNTKVNWLINYGIATPLAIFVCLTNYVTTDMEWKIRACLGCSSVCMLIMTAVRLWALLCADWEVLAEAVASRANSDEKEALSPTIEKSPILTSSPVLSRP